MTAEAARNTVKWPFRWVSMTASHSSSDMLNSIRSRRMPAIATTPSIRPHRSTPAPTIFSPPARVVTLSATATASPPAASISATSASATSLLRVLTGQADPDVGHHHPGPLGRGGQRHGPTDATPGTGDGHHLALQELLSAMLSLLPGLSRSGSPPSSVTAGPGPRGPDAHVDRPAAG